MRAHPVTRRPGLRKSAALCLSRASPRQAQARATDEEGKDGVGVRNEPRSHEEPTRDRKRPATGISPQPQEKCGGHRNADRLQPRPGSNCSSGPHGKLRLLTDGAHRLRLQLPEASAHGPQNGCQRGRFLIRKRRRNSQRACASPIVLGHWKLYFPECSGAREKWTLH